MDKNLVNPFPRQFRLTVGGGDAGPRNLYPSFARHSITCLRLAFLSFSFVLSDLTTFLRSFLNFFK